MKLVTWFWTWLRRWSIDIIPADDSLITRQWPVMEKITPQEADDLRARAAMRRTLAAEKYAEGRRLRVVEKALTVPQRKP